MATIITKTSRLPVVDKCQRGRTIISMSTDNPLVPGNAAALAAFAAAQQELYAAELSVVGARGTLREMVTKRDAAEKRWDDAISQLAGFTNFATGGSATAILSAGFRIREPGAPAQPLPAPQGLRALTNGKPGRTSLTWHPLDGALIYFLQFCPAPLADDGWRDLPASTKSSCEVDGAEPGKLTWFRVAAVNTVGQSPWSAPASRSVM